MFLRTVFGVDLKRPSRVIVVVLRKSPDYFDVGVRYACTAIRVCWPPPQYRHFYTIRSNLRIYRCVKINPFSGGETVRKSCEKYVVDSRWKFYFPTVKPSRAHIMFPAKSGSGVRNSGKFELKILFMPQLKKINVRLFVCDEFSYKFEFQTPIETYYVIVVRIKTVKITAKKTRRDILKIVPRRQSTGIGFVFRLIIII